MIALAIAWALVVARSLVYIAYEQSFFDSDQAIWGLMAKHLVEGRAFPLFCYGQDYMLAVDAWMAAPFFAVGGPTVAMLHTSMMASNLIAVTLIIVGLSQSNVVRPWAALTASLFFAFMPPLTGASLLEPAANVGPFVFIALLWFTRDRPIWFGTTLAVGFLNREFVVYAIPVLLAQQAWTRTLWQPARLRTWAIAGGVAFAGWLAILALKPYADMLGPGTRGQLLHGSAGSQLGNLTQRIDVTPAEFPARTAAMLLDHLPRLYGAKRVVDPIASQGRDWMIWPLGFGLLVAAARAVRGWTAQRRSDLPESFPVYLIGVGLVAIAAYVATRDAEPFVDRYLLLGLYLPIGLVALFFATEPARGPRLTVTAVMVLWAASSAVDHVQQAARYWNGRQPNPLRALEEDLVARGIQVAAAEYWRAYKLTFLSRERVVVASTNVVRIEEYQRRAEQEGDRLITIQERPCPGGEHIEAWYLCRRTE